MKKKIIAVIMCSLLTGSVMTACSNASEESSRTTDTTTVTTSSTASTEVEAVEKEASAPSATAATADNIDAKQTEPEEEVVTTPEGDSYQFVDETVTNPTVAPVEIPEPDENAESVSITAERLAGTYKPLIATSVADGKEVAFQNIFGSSFNESGGSLTISSDGSFTISMGAAIQPDKGRGTFTTSSYYLLVSYADGSADTFLYIPKYQNKEVIKIQIDDHYVYFYKE